MKAPLITQTLKLVNTQSVEPIPEPAGKILSLALLKGFIYVIGY